MSVYGYARVSTIQQKINRQEENIKDFNNNAIIYKEKQSGKDVDGREIFKKLLNKLKSGDTIIFDEVSRMSRNAEEGFNLYMQLMEKQGINLIFLKERHIDTDEYKRRTQQHIKRLTSGDRKVDNLINGILELVSEFERENLKDNIRLAFEHAEHERKMLIKRVKDGKNRSSNHQGRPAGSKNKNTAKEAEIKKIIIELSKDFQGNFSDAKIMKEYINVSRNTYYKYKQELKNSHN